MTWANNRFVCALSHELSEGSDWQILDQPDSYHVSRKRERGGGGAAEGSGRCLRHADGAGATRQRHDHRALHRRGAARVVPLVSLVAFLGFGGIYVAISFASRKALKLRGRIIARAQSDRIRAVQEGLGGIRDVLIDGTQPFFLEKFRRYEAPFKGRAR